MCTLVNYITCFLLVIESGMSTSVPQAFPHRPFLHDMAACTSVCDFCIMLLYLLIESDSQKVNSHHLLSAWTVKTLYHINKLRNVLLSDECVARVINTAVLCTP